MRFLVLMLLTGCAAEHYQPRFSPPDIAKIQYDARSCKEQPDGRIKCSSVYLVLKSVRAK